MREELEKIREWADSKIASGSEPPWAWYQYMKLRETVDAILGGIAATLQTANLQESERRRDVGLRLVESKNPQDTALRRPAGIQTRLPT